MLMKLMSQLFLFSVISIIVNDPYAITLGKKKVLKINKVPVQVQVKLKMSHCRFLFDVCSVKVLVQIKLTWHVFATNCIVKFY